MIQQQITNAFSELQRKTLHNIQVETAYVWAGRAIAAKKLNKLHDAQEYAHEALEHAALAGSNVYAEINAYVRAILCEGS